MLAQGRKWTGKRGYISPIRAERVEFAQIGTKKNQRRDAAGGRGRRRWRRKADVVVTNECPPDCAEIVQRGTRGDKLCTCHIIILNHHLPWLHPEQARKKVTSGRLAPFERTSLASAAMTLSQSPPSSALLVYSSTGTTNFRQICVNIHVLFYKRQRGGREEWGAVLVGLAVNIYNHLIAPLRVNNGSPCT